MFISPTPNKYLLVLFAQMSPDTPHHTTLHHRAPHRTTTHSTYIHLHTQSQKRKEQNVMELMYCNVL